MRLAKLGEFRRLIYTPESAPSESTLRRRIDKNLIPGGTFREGHYYVDLDEFARATNLRARLAAEQAELEKDPVLKGLSKLGTRVRVAARLLAHLTGAARNVLLAVLPGPARIAVCLHMQPSVVRIKAGRQDGLRMTSLSTMLGDLESLIAFGLRDPEDGRFAATAAHMTL